MRAWLALALIGIAGCYPAPLDLSNRRCPCAPGWTCDTAHDRCVQGPPSDATSGNADAPPSDAAADALVSIDGGNDARAIDAAATDTASIDAPPIDAASVDAASIDLGPDMGHDGGMPGDTGCGAEFAGAILCDGFETDPGPWTGRREVTGSVMADGLQAARGTRSEHAMITTGSGQAARDFDGFGPFVDGDLWVRVSVYVPSTTMPYDFTWFSIGEPMPPYHGISLGMGGATIGSYSTISATYVSNSALTLPTDTWWCLELHVVVSDTAGAVEIYQGGVLRASHTGIDTRPDGGFTEFGAGIDYSDPMQPALETWIDEIVLSRSRFPCP